MQPELLEDLMLIEAMDAQGDRRMPGGMDEIDEIDAHENIVEVNINPTPERDVHIQDRGEEGEDDEDDDDNEDEEEISVCHCHIAAVLETNIFV